MIVYDRVPQASPSTQLPPSTVPPERKGVVAQPSLPPSGGRLVELVALSETTGLLAGGSESAGFAVLE